MDRILCDRNQEHIGCDMFCGAFEDIPEKYYGSASLVVIIESLEHHISPVDTLRMAWKCAREDGIVFVDVPNIDFWENQFNIEAHQWFVSDHLMYFSGQSLRRAFELAGFHDIVVETSHGKHPDYQGSLL